MNKGLSKLVMFFMQITMIFVWLGCIFYALLFAYTSVVHAKKIANQELDKYRFHRASKFKTIKAQ
jgi:hypothetical protein